MSIIWAMFLAPRNRNVNKESYFKHRVFSTDALNLPEATLIEYRLNISCDM